MTDTVNVPREVLQGLVEYARFDEGCLLCQAHEELLIDAGVLLAAAPKAEPDYRKLARDVDRMHEDGTIPTEAPKVEQEPSFLGHVITYPDGRKPDFAPASEGVSVGESCTVTAAFSRPWHPAPASDELLSIIIELVEHFERVDGDAEHKALIKKATKLYAKHKGPQS